ncbi:phosphoglycerate mutase [Pseudoluteimonas lycopersici]|uniref:Phosphoglycerate mutase n=1 Tax=Pseudoluteimonas lycopersici TaxID=1324796 RepID=A0A516V2W1_9GAMM|nr:phosphoglycerate mutase [Lysobacter lycopersici]QDQ72870.1 phosphoglycerate mutase [Lysobacter lycopersici]
MARAVLLLPPLACVFAGTPPADLARALGRADRVDGESGRAAQLRRHFSLLPNRWPEAAVCRLAEIGADVDDVRRHAWLRVDPAHLRADIKGVLLLGTGEALGLDEADSVAFLPALKPLFGDAGFQLEAPHPARWYLRLPKEAKLPAFASPEIALGDDVFEHAPDGPEARRWNALASEAQVLLHNHPRNVQRAEAGRVALNALWPWGGGTLPDHATAAFPKLHSDDALLHGLARLAKIEAMPAKPPIPEDALFDLRKADAATLRPMLEALHRGDLQELALDFADGPRFTLRRGQRWRFWRKPFALLRE